MMQQFDVKHCGMVIACNQWHFYVMVSCVHGCMNLLSRQLCYVLFHATNNTINLYLCYLMKDVDGWIPIEK